MSTEEVPMANLTAEECEELATFLTEDALTLPLGKREDVLELARGYRELGKIKDWLRRQVN